MAAVIFCEPSLPRNVYTEASLSYARFPIYLSTTARLRDYAANNIKIFIIRRLIESNRQRLLSETLLLRVLLGYLVGGTQVPPGSAESA